MDLLLIAGVSGSGKSVALAALEDSGYYAVSNLPLTQLAGLLAHLKARRQQRVAIVLDVKTTPDLNGVAKAIDAARGDGWTVRFLYLDAKTDTLVKRFSETRRRHPFSDDTRTLKEAIEFERARLTDVRSLGYSFDTSDLSAGGAARVDQGLHQRRSVETDAAVPVVRFQARRAARRRPGIRRALPAEPALRTRPRSPRPARTPRSSRISSASPRPSACIEDIHHFVASWLPDYARDNRNYLTVAIGCTGGQHRSVYLVERLARAFAGRYQVQTRHRELAGGRCPALS